MIRLATPTPDRTRAALAARRAAVAGAAIVAAALAAMRDAAAALAASPSPTAAAGGDPRSSGQGPGLVGDPLMAIVVVAVIAVGSVVATLLYVRQTGGPRDHRPSR